MSSPVTKRLCQDLKQLQQEPIVGANAIPVSGNLMRWYGIVVGSGHLSGIPIRFCLDFPNDYPNSPPKAYFESFISYTSGLQVYDKKGRVEVCLNIFGNFRESHSSWKTEASGWSSAYTVSTILLSMQSLVMQGMLSKKMESVQKMTKSALDFKCYETGHVGSDSTKWFPQVIQDPDVARSIIEYHQKRNPRSNGILQTFYVCYANTEFNGNNSVIGYGVQIENLTNGILTSPCEYLSNNSFFQGRIRSGSRNQQFRYWLPILLRSEDWDWKIKKQLLHTVELICSRINYIGPIHQKVFKVCSSLMNSLVVEIMNNKRNSTANDKFINGYFSIFRLLYQYAQCDKQLISFSNESLKTFITNEKSRHKSYVPNLGEFLMHLTISTEFQWEDISKVFMNECDARNVFWYCEGNKFNYPPYPELSDVNYAGHRSEKVFEATKVSRNLVMFQIKFANVTKFLDLTEFNSNYGLAPEFLRDELKGLYSIIVAVKNWKDFFKFIDMPQMDNDEREKELVEAVKRSASQGYHNNIQGKHNTNHVLPRFRNGNNMTHRRQKEITLFDFVKDKL